MLSFIIQARLGSTRLPGKILLPFWEGKSIFELLLEKLNRIEGVGCIVATSVSPANDQLAKICQRYDTPCFRGDENDVLKRFVDAAELYGVDKIIRVCSDNPFLNVSDIERLVSFSRSADYDYISFDVNGTPSIKTHYGFWTEYVKLDALRKVESLTSEKLYHEHVTNFIYSHPGLFKIAWLPVSELINENKDVRLTIDTPQDFENAKTVYAAIGGKASYEELFGFIQAHPEMVDAMRKQIINNTK